MLEHAIDAALERKADDDVGTVRGGEMGHDVRKERIVSPSDEVARPALPRLCAEIVASTRNDVSHAAARVRNVAGIPWNDVDVEVRHRLASCSADVHADVERRLACSAAGWRRVPSQSRQSRHGALLSLPRTNSRRDDE